MPEVVNIYPLDIHVEVRMSLSELNMLADFLDQCEFTLDKDSKENVECHKYVMRKFFPFINKLTDDLVKESVDGLRSDSTVC